MSQSESQSKKSKLLLIDGSNLAFRMYYALEYTRMTAPDGRPSWAIFGFFKGLLDVIEREKATQTVAVFDSKEKTFRHDAFDYYKANRPTEMPDELSAQWHEILRGLQILGIDLVKLPGYEADDLIGTFAVQAHNDTQDWDTVIYSGDKDVLQLVDTDVEVLMPSVKGTHKLNIEKVIEKLGVKPEQVIDYKALCGDSSDNIPGVKGIGDKTAIKLLTEYTTLENIYDNIPNIKGAVQKKLIQDKSNAFDSKFLATIRVDCPMTLKLDTNFELKPNIQDLQAFLTEYKLGSIAKKLPQIFPELSTLTEQTNLLESLPANNTSTKSQFATLPTISKKLIQTEDEVLTLYKQLAKAQQISLDLETTGLDTATCDIVGWAWAYMTPGGNIRSYYIPTRLIDNNLIVEQTKTLLSSWAKPLFIQNIKYEYKIFKRFNINLLPYITLDTMLASYIQNPDYKHGLKKQSVRVFDYTMTELTDLIGTNKRTQLPIQDIPVEQLSDYACDDAAITLALGDYYNKTLSEAQLALWKKLESPLCILLADMELTGIQVNLSQLKELSQELTLLIDQTKELIYSELDPAHQSINLNSSTQVGSALIAKDFKLTKKTASGYYSTDMSVLNKLRDLDETSLIDNIIEYRTLSKLYSTYVESFHELAQANRIHTEFNQTMTSTGRLSSSNPNLQNIPIRNPKFANLIRGTFEASQGKTLICADYSQIELRILAHYTQDTILLEAFNLDQDIHARTAAEIFNKNINNITSEERRLGKTLNFALLYQQGAYSTAKQLSISTQEAQDFMHKYFASFPTIQPFIENVLDKARDQQYTETLWGRRRYFQNLNASNMNIRRAEERAAFNMPLQGSAADLIKYAMLTVNDNLAGTIQDSNILLQVHDELVIAVPDQAGIITQAKNIIKTSMLQPHNNKITNVKLDINIEVGKTWADCKV